MLGSMSRSRKDTNATQRYYCHQIRHYQYYFKKLRVGLKEFKKSYDIQRLADAAIATTNSDGEDCHAFLMVIEGMDSIKNSWILDSA